MIFEKITVVHTVWYCYIAKRVNASVHWLRGNFWGGGVWKHTSNLWKHTDYIYCMLPMRVYLLHCIGNIQIIHSLTFNFNLGHVLLYLIYRLLFFNYIFYIFTSAYNSLQFRPTVIWVQQPQTSNSDRSCLTY